MIICITGASGFIGSHIVQVALARGNTVHGTVRDAKDDAKNKHLLAMDGAGERLRLFSVDLNGPPDAFDDAVTGCEAVIHVATPLILSPKDGEAEILKPALRGTESLLDAVERAGTCTTFVLTSSMSAVSPRPEPNVKTEEHWSDAEGQKERGNWYGAAKTLQEKFVQEKLASSKIRFVAICPTWVLGPMLQPRMNETMGMLAKWGKEGKGGDKAPNDSMSFVDVRDVAEMHKLDNIKGRYMAIAGEPVPDTKLYQATHWNELFQIIKQLYPDMPDVPLCDGELVVPTKYDLSNMNTLLQVREMRDIRSIFSDSIDNLKETGAL